jgi:hypothetical protein
MAVMTTSQVKTWLAPMSTAETIGPSGEPETKH